MNNTEGTIYHYFDDSLTGLLQLLERTLPHPDYCRDTAYIDWENEHYQLHCAFALREMKERAALLVQFRKNDPSILETQVLGYDTYSSLLKRLDAQSSRQNEEGVQLIAGLKTEINRLLNRGLTDEEEQKKWERLKHKAQFTSPLVKTYTRIHEFYEDENPDEKELRHFILTCNYPDNEVLCFMQSYLNKAGRTSFGVVEEPTSTVSQPAVKTTKKAKEAKIVSSTLKYRWQKEAPQRVVLLYQRLLKAKWIDPKTKPEDFCRLFSGENREFHIKWMSTIQNLWYLFKLIIDKRYVTIPDGLSKWVVIGSHFVDKEGRPFTDWNKQHEPKYSKPAIENLAEILNPNTDTDRRVYIKN